MQEIYLLKHNVDFCSGCKSIFLDQNELKLVKHGDVGEFEKIETFGERPRQDHIKINCPACSNKMREFVFAYDSNVYIDRCDNCGGIFLDQGELLAINNFLEKVEREDVSPEIVKNLKTEKVKVDANFEMMKAENDKLYKLIDEIPGIKYAVNFISHFF